MRYKPISVCHRCLSGATQRVHWSRQGAVVSVFLLLIGTLYAGTSVLADSALCMECHEDQLDEPFNASWHVAHSTAGRGQAADCTDCHGQSEAHTEDPGEALPDVLFSGEQASSADARNDACLGCHRGAEHAWWDGSTHDDEGLACADCHRVHTSVNLVANRQEQATLCYTCHPQVRASARLRTRHPIEEAKTVCTDCHNPHGSSTEAMLNEPTLNDTCYSCHAEKRGPYLFEHQPVTEDCSHCHEPHGSVNEALLTARTPFLCQQCHSVAFHPSQPYGAAAAQSNSNRYLLGKNCLNCHVNVHGSNHPSGARLTR